LTNQTQTFLLTLQEIKSRRAVIYFYCILRAIISHFMLSVLTRMSVCLNYQPSATSYMLLRHDHFNKLTNIVY